MRSTRVATLLLLAGLLAIAAGYWGPWIWAEPAGLRVLGVDLAEYVKFMAEVRSGQVRLVREVFYLPLVALSLSLSLLAHRGEYHLPTPVRWPLNALAVPTALAMLPPAWTPALLTQPEFIKQTLAIALCLAAALLSYPLLRRLPRLVAAVAVGLTAILALVAPLAAFFPLRPALEAIYGGPAPVGRGPWQMALGLTLLTLAALLPEGRSPAQRR